MGEALTLDGSRPWLVASDVIEVFGRERWCSSEHLLDPPRNDVFDRLRPDPIAEDAADALLTHFGRFDRRTISENVTEVVSLLG